MQSDRPRRQPPIWLILPVVFTLLSLCSVGVTWLCGLPWQVPISAFWARFIGLILLAVGFPLLLSVFRTLAVRRAFGKEIYKPSTESSLVTTGLYAYARNPLYLTSTVLLLGWFFVFRFTPLLILTVLFVILFVFVAKWEEKELAARFGPEYLRYKQSVPLFIPWPTRRLRH
jgi:protein-S-isoprenylcysteine O-methyltransferase Ste14